MRFYSVNLFHKKEFSIKTKLHVHRTSGIVDK